MTAIALPPKPDTTGIETRVLLAESRTPASPSYVAADAEECMKLMDLVLWNRVDNPKPFLAKNPTLLAVVKAPGQFAGFESYPHYDGHIINRIQQMISIANSGKDSRSTAFRDHIELAIRISTTATINDPSAGKVCFWRTAGASAPGGSAKFFKTVMNNDFYFM